MGVKNNWESTHGFQEDLAGCGHWNLLAYSEFKPTKPAPFYSEYRCVYGLLQEHVCTTTWSTRTLAQVRYVDETVKVP